MIPSMPLTQRTKAIIAGAVAGALLWYYFVMYKPAVPTLDFIPPVPSYCSPAPGQAQSADQVTTSTQIADLQTQLKKLECGELPDAEERAAAWRSFYVPDIIADPAAQRERSWCSLHKFGKGYGGHNLCDFVTTPCKPCGTVMSYGIERDWSFDRDMHARGCQLYMFDPSVDHPHVLDGMPFFKIGARAPPIPAFPEWTGKYLVTSVPSMAKALRIGHIRALKMDCEGCEFALGEDIWNEDCRFFERVDAFHVELHLCKGMMQPDGEDKIGLLFALLRRAGFVALSDETTPCGTGKTPAMKLQHWAENPLCCHNLLLAKPAAFGKH